MSASRTVKIDGKEMALSDAIKRYRGKDISAHGIYQRIKRADYKISSAELMGAKRGRIVVVDGVKMTVAEAARRYLAPGMTEVGMRYRLNRKKSHKSSDLLKPSVFFADARVSPAVTKPSAIGAYYVGLHGMVFRITERGGVRASDKSIRAGAAISSTRVDSKARMGAVS